MGVPEIPNGQQCFISEAGGCFYYDSLCLIQITNMFLQALNINLKYICTCRMHKILLISPNQLTLEIEKESV